MKKLLLILIALPMIGFGQNSCFSGTSNVIQNFINYIEWYHEGWEIDKKNIQVWEIKNGTYSIKFNQWHTSSSLSTPCFDCRGSGKVKKYKTNSKGYNFNDLSVYTISTEVPCSECSGKGKIGGEKRRDKLKRFATMTCKDNKEYTIEFK